MDYEILYYGGKKKALTFSYDDGEYYDRRLVDIFNAYKMKSTFHLNSGKLGLDGYVLPDEINALYKGHEIANHGFWHRYLCHLSPEQLAWEVGKDRFTLEELTDSYVLGMSYAFGEYNEQVIETLKALGIQYSRTVESTGNFQVPGNFMKWNPTCHHNDHMIERGEEFLNTPSYMKLPLFYIWGHSFEFHREDNWGVIESFCERMADHDDIWYVTNLEYKNYVTAVRSLIYRKDEKYVKNPSAIPIWIQVESDTYILEAGMELEL